MEAYMRYRQYKFKFYLNASHAIYINGNLGEKHPHTWEICLNVLKMQETFVQFNEVEIAIEQFMSNYQNKFLNEIQPFDLMNPTLENSCEYFKSVIAKLLNSKGWILLAIEMSETPSRSYVINLLDDEDTEEKQSLEVLAEDMISKIIAAKGEREYDGA